jgi:two-component system LytT family response regulator
MPRCILVDDDAFALDHLGNMLESQNNVKILKKIKDSDMAIKHIYTLKPDVVFLDIGMPDKDGLEVLNEINELNVPTKVIFTTAYKDYVFDAFRQKAFDYLVKPINKKELEEAIMRLQEEKLTEKTNHTPSQKSYEKNIIPLRNSHGTIFLETNNILYLQAEGSYTNAFDIHSGNIVISKNLGKIEGEFPGDIFFKISRSALVNMKYITKIDRVKKQIILKHKKGKPISLKASKERLYDLEVKIREIS